MSEFFDFEDGRGLVPFSIHSYGGGKVAHTACVDSTVFVGEGCEVFGRARVKDRVRITGRVRIGGDFFPKEVSTLIEDDVKVSGNVQITGCVLLRDQVDVRDGAILKGCVQVLHHARIHGNAILEGWVSIKDSAYICGRAHLQGLTEELVVRGETYLREGFIQTAQELILASKKDQLKNDASSRKRVFKS